MGAPKNQGHGHVKPRPDGSRARCGGPALCNVCAKEKAAFDIENKVLETIDDTGLEPNAEELARANESYQDQAAQASPPAPTEPKPDPKRRADPAEEYNRHPKFAKFKGRT